MAPEWRALRMKMFPARDYVEKAKTVVRSLISLVRPEETNEP
jgi:hypothetical protein